MIKEPKQMAVAKASIHRNTGVQDIAMADNLTWHMLLFCEHLYLSEDHESEIAKLCLLEK